jgi:integrase
MWRHSTTTEMRVKSNSDPRKKPYWTRSGKTGVHLGYRRRKPHGRDANGSWVARRYIRYGEQWGTHDQHRPIAEARAGASLDEEVTFHVLRHTYASMLVKAGVHLSIVAQSLGHADTRMIEKHYGHLAPSPVAQAIRANLPNFAAPVRQF